MSMNERMIAVESLVAGYGKKEILHGSNMEIKPKEITTLIGRNGVGKTTLMQTIMGFLRPLRGHILFQGKDISGWKAHLIAKMGISYVPQGKAIFPHMTVAEHLDIGAWNVANPSTRNSRMEEMYTLFPRLAERKPQKGIRRKILPGWPCAWRKRFRRRSTIIPWSRSLK